MLSNNVFSVNIAETNCINKYNVSACNSVYNI